jgi:hypothetical protein
MIDETDRGLAERWAWWFLANLPSNSAQREAGCMEWFLSFELPPSPLALAERDDLLLRTRRRMQEYKAGTAEALAPLCSYGNLPGPSNFPPSTEDYAEWLGLDLGGVFESAGKLTHALVKLAVEHGRGAA